LIHCVRQTLDIN